MLEVREYTDADRSYVISTWLHSYWKAAAVPGKTVRATFHRELDAAIKESLTNGMRVRIAYDDTAPAVIVGWIAFGPGAVLHYVYTRGPFRRSGVATALATGVGPFQRYTHRTPDFGLFIPLSTINPFGHDPPAFPVRKT